MLTLCIAFGGVGKMWVMHIFGWSNEFYENKDVIPWDMRHAAGLKRRVFVWQGRLVE